MSGKICGTGTFSSPIVLDNDSDSESETEWPESDDAILATNSDLGWSESDNETNCAQAIAGAVPMQVHGSPLKVSCSDCYRYVYQKGRMDGRILPFIAAS